MSELLTCPFCKFSKEVPMEKRPSHQVNVTCPNCRKNFTYIPSHFVQKPAGVMFNDSHPSIDRAEAMRPSSFQESTSPPNPSAILTVPRYFYFPRHMRIFFSLAPVVPVTLLFSQQILPFKISQMPTEGIIVLAVLLIVFFLLTIFVAWRIWQPLLTLSINGIEQKPFFKTNFVPWSSIQGMTVSEITIHGKIKEMVKLVIATEKGGTRESTICTYGLEGGEEALSILRKIVPEKKAGDFFRTPKQMKPLQTDAMRYRDIEVSCEGIVFKGERIPWDSIINLSTEGMVIAGYGSISVEYSGTGKRNKFIIRASITDDYLDCVKLILSRAKNAVVDPGMIAMLGYPPAAAKKDICAVVLIATGVLLAFGGLIVLSFYPPTVASTWLYPLLLLPLAIAPLVWTIKLLSARFERGTADSTRKIIGAALVNLGTIFAVAILFSLSPASFLWLMADTAVLTGHMAQAEELYVKAEPTLGKNEDFIFTLGQFYFRKGDWNRAAAYYIRSYDKDPTNWMTEPLAKIPDSLTKAGRHEEALQWCERIIKQYAGNRQVTSMIEKKKMEIIRILGEKQS